MEQEHLKESLQQLHQQLLSGESIDPEVQVLLKQLAVDVDALAARTFEEADRGEQATVQAEKQTLLDRMLDLTEEFEETHPRLADAIGRVATALSRIGI